MEMVVAYIFRINNNTLLCIVDYYSKFPVMKRADGLSGDELIRATKTVFAEFGPLEKKCQIQAQTTCQTNSRHFAGS